MSVEDPHAQHGLDTYWCDAPAKANMLFAPSHQTQLPLPWLCRATLQMALAAPVDSMIAQHACSLGVAPSARLMTRDAGWSPCLAALQGHTHKVTSVAVTPDGGTLVSGSKDGTIRWEGWLRPCAKGDVDRHEVSWSVSGSGGQHHQVGHLGHRVQAVAGQLHAQAAHRVLVPMAKHTARKCIGITQQCTGVHRDLSPSCSFRERPDAHLQDLG